MTSTSNIQTQELGNDFPKRSDHFRQQRRFSVPLRISSFFRGTVFGIIVLIPSLFLLMLIFNSFGLKSMYVVSDSMVPMYSTGDMIVVSTKDYGALAKGDVVAYTADWLDDKIVTHRIVSIDENTLITKGDANVSVDPTGSPSSIVGEVVGVIPYVGYFINQRHSAILELSLIFVFYSTYLIDGWILKMKNNS